MFQKVRPETRKLRRPKVIVFVRGMTKSPQAADLRFARPDVSDTLKTCLLLLLLSSKLFKKLSQKLLAVHKHETDKKRWHEQQITEC